MMRENRPTMGKISFELDEKKSEIAVNRINDILVDMSLYYLKNREKFPNREKTG